MLMPSEQLTIEHTMNRDISGILVAIDLEKAFDSLNLNFLLRLLHAFSLVLLSFSGYESCIVRPPAVL